MNWLITGASSGLGRALAAAALARGDRVAGLVRDAAQAPALEALAPGRAYGLAADMANEAEVTAAVQAAETQLGGIDVLVNNAGYGLVGAVEETSLEEARDLFAVNLLGPLAAIRAALPHFRRRRAGHVINVTSVSGVAAWWGTGLYCASKYALEGLGQTLAQEVEPLGIKVTNVAPGGMRTDYAGRSLRKTAERFTDYDTGARTSERILADHAGHESGDPAKVAAAILRIAGAPDAPVQLLLGADAVLYATAAAARFQAEFGRFAALSLSTGFSES